MYNNSNVINPTGQFVPQNSGQISHGHFPNLYSQEPGGHAVGLYQNHVLHSAPPYQHHQQHGGHQVHISKAGPHNIEVVDARSVLEVEARLSSTSPEASDSDEEYEPEIKKSKKKALGDRTMPRKRVVPASPKSKRSDKIRSFFDTQNGKSICKVCSRSVSGRVVRLKQHLDKHHPMDAERNFVDTEMNSSNEVSRVTEDEEDGETDFVEAITKPKKLGRKTDNRTGIGRHKSEVWQFFEERDEGRFFCKKCGKRVSSKANRLHKHLMNTCIDSPRPNRGDKPPARGEIIKDYAKQHFNLIGASWHCKQCNKTVGGTWEKMKKHVEYWCSVTGMDKQDRPPVPPVIPDPRTTLRVLAPSCSTTSTATSAVKPPKSNEMHKLVARFIYSANLPFEIVKRPSFINMLNLHAGKSPLPTLTDLSGPLLDEIDNEVQLEMKDKLKEKSVTIIQAGWSKRENLSSDTGQEALDNSQYLITHAVHNGKQAYFLSATLLKAKDASPEKSLELLKQAESLARDALCCYVVGILTDHDASSSEHLNLIRVNNPSTHVYGCYLHLLQTLGEDLVKTSVLDQASGVQEFFYTLQRLHAIPEDFSGLTIVTDEEDDNRLLSQSSMLNSFLTNHGRYCEISTNTDTKIPGNIKDLLEDSGLPNRVQELVSLLVPLSEACKKIQTNTASVADAVSCVLSLINDSQIASQYKEKICGIFNESVTPMAVAAYLLHPVYKGEGMSPEQQEIGRMWLLEQDPMFVVVQSALERSDSSYFPLSFLNAVVAKQMGPAVWWENAGKWPSIPPGLKNLAVSLMVLPASTNTVDRCISSISCILRSRKESFGYERCQKLANVHFTLKSKDESLLV